LNHAQARLKAMCVLALSALLLGIASPALAGTPPSAKQTASARHVVEPAEVRASAVAAVSEREANARRIAGLLDSKTARAAMARWGVSPERARVALSRLDDRELAALSAAADDLAADVQGGISKLWIWAGVGAAVVVAICVYLLATTEY
jgi:hypothetical protein